MIYLLIFTTPAAFFVLYKLPFWEASRDKKSIDANGPADTLKEWFHFLRGVRRGLVQGAVVALATAPLLFAEGFKPWVLAAAGLGLAGLGWFFYAFNSQLSLLRGLDPWYLSRDPRAALFPDRALTKLGWGLKPVALTLLGLCLLAAVLLGGAALVVASRG